MEPNNLRRSYERLPENGTMTLDFLKGVPAKNLKQVVTTLLSRTCPGFRPVVSVGERRCTVRKERITKKS